MRLHCTAIAVLLVSLYNAPATTKKLAKLLSLRCFAQNSAPTDFSLPCFISRLTYLAVVGGLMEGTPATVVPDIDFSSLQANDRVKWRTTRPVSTWRMSCLAAVRLPEMAAR